MMELLASGHFHCQLHNLGKVTPLEETTAPERQGRNKGTPSACLCGWEEKRSSLEYDGTPGSQWALSNLF